MQRVLIASSGNVDSSLLLKMARQTLEAKNVLVVAVDSSIYLQGELRFAHIC